MQEKPDYNTLLVRLRRQEEEIISLRAQLEQRVNVEANGNPVEHDKENKTPWPLKQTEYRRYGRQMILPQIGNQGQLRLQNAAVLIVGLGGLGCPAAAYLAAAGVGTIGLMDGDIVELSNLHRQILHTTERVGMLKVESARISLHQLNPLVKYRLHRHHLTPSTAVDDLRLYNVILDCTDHPTARYLVSDAAVCAEVPLIFGAALRTDGQLCILNFPPFRPDATKDYTSGPCYRCLNPKPPPLESLSSCAEGGILGSVVGTIGVLMATEAVKILIAQVVPSDKCKINAKRRGARHDLDATEWTSQAESTPHSMLLYSALAPTPFRSVKIRGRRPKCVACSPDPAFRTISTETLRSHSIDYLAFCGQLPPVYLLSPEARMDPRALVELQREAEGKFLLLDTREKIEFEICSLSGSMNTPLSELERHVSNIAEIVEGSKITSLITVCRFGNDSQAAAKVLKAQLGERFEDLWFGDIRGGLDAWRREIDPELPDY